MKGIYLTFILIAIISIFSVQTSAQNGNNALPNGTAGVTSNNTQKGMLNGTVAGARRSLNTSKGKHSRVVNDAADSTSIDSVAGSSESRINAVPINEDFFGVPAPQNREIDRYGYQGSPLSNGTRPCLVAGARRCVQ